jgi:hypothetical protein
MLHMLSAALGLAMLPAAAAAGGAASAPAFPVCVSKPLTTPPFARRGKPPGFETLSLCSRHAADAARGLPTARAPTAAAPAD